KLGHHVSARWIDDEVRAEPVGHLPADGHGLDYGEPSSAELFRPLDPLDAVVGRAEHDDVVAQAKTRAPDASDGECHAFDRRKLVVPDRIRDAVAAVSGHDAVLRHRSVIELAASRVPERVNPDPGSRSFRDAALAHRGMATATGEAFSTIHSGIDCRALTASPAVDVGPNVDDLPARHLAQYHAGPRKGAGTIHPDVRLADATRRDAHDELPTAGLRLGQRFDGNSVLLLENNALHASSFGVSVDRPSDSSR